MLTPGEWNILVEQNSSSKNFGHKANLKLWKREVMKGVGWVEKVEADLNSELAMIGDADSQGSWLCIGTIFIYYYVMNICVSTIQGPAGSTQNSFWQTSQRI